MLKQLVTSVMLAAAICTPAVFAQRNQMAEIQRDLALLQQDVRDMQQKQEERWNEIKLLLQQLTESQSKANTSLAVLDSAVRDRLREQERNVVVPVTSLGTKVDRMSEEFRFVKESVADLNSRMGKLEQRIVDLNNAIQIMQSPPSPPPAETDRGSRRGGQSAGSATPQPSASLPPVGLTAEGLYKDAMRDKTAGNYEMALQEFEDYLRYFGDTELAPNAQYYIGEIHYLRKDYQKAVQAFDMVLEKFPPSNKTLDARYMKGLALVQLGQRNEGAEEFREIVRLQPRGEMASKARAELKKLGLSAPRVPPDRN